MYYDTSDGDRAKHLWIKETLLHVTIAEQKSGGSVCIVGWIGSAVVACIYMI